MAVAQWYSQKEFFNTATGLAVEGKEDEAEEYVNVVYTDTETVGFGVIHPYVIGWYCPKADMDPNVLKTQVTEASVVEEDITTVIANEIAAAEFSQTAANAANV